MAYANEHFASESQDETDRGRIYISRQPAEDRVNIPGGVTSACRTRLRLNHHLLLRDGFTGTYRAT